MANVLHKPKTNFTQISNTALNDKKLSLKGKGMLAFMLSKPDEWKFSTEGLKSQLLEGDTAVRTALKDLRDNNYLKIEPKRNEQGMIDCWEYSLSHKPEVRSPDVGKPQLDPKHYSKTIKSKKECSNNISVKFSENSFEEFWKAVPRKVEKRGCKNKIKTILKNGEADWQTLIAGMKRYNQFCESTRKETRYIKHPKTWLNNGCWDDQYQEAKRTDPVQTDSEVIEIDKNAGEEWMEKGEL